MKPSLADAFMEKFKETIEQIQVSNTYEECVPYNNPIELFFES